MRGDQAGGIDLEVPQGIFGAVGGRHGALDVAFRAEQQAAGFLGRGLARGADHFRKGRAVEGVNGAHGKRSESLERGTLHGIAAGAENGSVATPDHGQVKAFVTAL
jgi:hypothetical protein